MNTNNYAVKIENVTVSQGDVVMLRDISLTINRGDFVAIIGPNGAGKTTLLKIMLGLMQPDNGIVQILGNDINSLGPKRCKIGYVPQIVSIDLNFPISVFETVLMGTYGSLGLVKNPGEAEKVLALKALETVGVSDLKDRPIGRLSGGQRQRAFIARAIVNEPELLILDEPTTGVDLTTTDSLYTILRNLKSRGVTIIYVSHDIGVVASYTDSLVCLNQTLVAHGKPDEIMNSDTLNNMYGCDVAYLHHCNNAPHIIVEDHNV